MTNVEPVPANAAEPPKPPEPSLRDQLAELWRAFPLRVTFLLLAGLWLAAFHFWGNSTFGYIDTPSLYSWFAYAYRDSEQGDLGYFVPFVVLLLLVWRRQELLSVAKGPSWIGAMILFAGVAVHVIGYMVQQPRVSGVGLFLGLYGLVGAIWGLRVLWLATFPFSLFAFCIPLGQSAEFLTFPLRMIVSKLSVGFSHNILGIDVMREGSLIFNGDRTYQYDVAPACSGIRSLTALGFIILLYAFTTFTSWWKRAVLVLSVIPLAVLGNTARIVAVIVAGETAGQEAGAAIEEKLGFLTFLVALGGALVVSWFLERGSKSRSGASTADGPPPPTAAAEGQA